MRRNDGVPLRNSQEVSQQLQLAWAAFLAEARSLISQDYDFVLVETPAASSAERDIAPIAVAIGQLVIKTYSPAARPADTTASSISPCSITRARAIELDESLSGGHGGRFYGGLR